MDTIFDNEFTHQVYVWFFMLIVYNVVMIYEEIVPIDLRGLVSLAFDVWSYKMEMVHLYFCFMMFYFKVSKIHI